MIGNEISIARHIHKPQPLHSLEEIRADMLPPKRDTKGTPANIIWGPFDE